MTVNEQRHFIYENELNSLSKTLIIHCNIRKKGFTIIRK